MVSFHVPSSRGVSKNAEAIQRQRMQVLSKKLLRQQLRQIVAKQSMQSWLSSGFNQVTAKRNFRSIDEFKTAKKEKQETQKRQDVEEAIQSVEDLEGLANQFNKKNPELNKRMLIALRNSIKNTDSPEEILRKVLEFYPDFTLADEALDFLVESSFGDLSLRMMEAKRILNERFAREVKAGKNIELQAREFSKVGLGSPTALRDMYRDITGNPREPVPLFDELSGKFSFAQMKTVISFLLHSLGADMKSKGPSIARAELQNLINDTRSLQSILGVYRFFGSRMNLINQQFKMNHLSLPIRLNFELLAKQFMSLFSERYITVDKIFQLGKMLGISEELLAQIIIYTQMRDAIRQISPRLYKNQQQKDDLLAAFLEALEELEEELEEDEDEDEDEDEE